MSDNFTIIRGDPYAQLRKTVQKYDPSRGYYYQYFYDCATQAPLISLANDYNAAGCITELTLENDKSTLSVEDPTQQSNIETWQIQGNRLDFDGLAHPALRALNAQGIPLVNDEQVAVIRAGIDNAEASGDNTGVNGIIAMILANKVFANANPAYTVQQLALIRTFIGLQFRGQKTFLRAQYVLKHTTNVSNRYPLNIADFYVLEIYNLAQLLAEITGGVSTPDGVINWTTPCPTPLQNQITIATNNLAQSFFGGLNDPDYVVGWLKMPSTQTTTAYNRVDIETEYILDSWSTYGNGGNGYYPIYVPE